MRVAPVAMVRFEVVAEVAKVHTPPTPFNVVVPSVAMGAVIVFPVVVAVKIVPEACGVNVAVDDAEKLPAMVVVPAAVYMLLAVMRNEPSVSDVDDALPCMVTAPPGANVFPV